MGQMERERGRKSDLVVLSRWSGTPTHLFRSFLRGWRVLGAFVVKGAKCHERDIFIIFIILEGDGDGR